MVSVKLDLSEYTISLQKNTLWVNKCKGWLNIFDECIKVILKFITHAKILYKKLKIVLQNSGDALTNVNVNNYIMW